MTRRTYPVIRPPRAYPPGALQKIVGHTGQPLRRTPPQPAPKPSRGAVTAPKED